MLFMRWQEIIEGAKWAVFFISSEYSQWLFVPVLFSGASATEYQQTLFFAALGIFLTLLLSVSICLRRSLNLTILFTVPFAFLTFVLIFNQADTIYLLGLLAVYLTMLFSNSLYPDNFVKRAQFVFPALALALIVMGSAYLLTPKDNYNREMFVRTLDYNIRMLANRAGLMRVKTGAGWPALYGELWGFNTDNVEISEAGMRTISDHGLLEVTATHAGTYYLRGYSMQFFDGNSWTEKADDSLRSEDHWARGTPAFVASVYAELFPDAAPPFVGISISRTGDVTRNVDYTPYYSFPNFWNDRSGQFDFYYVENSIPELYQELPPGDYPYLGYSGYQELYPQLPPGRYQNRGMAAYGEIVLRRANYLQIRGSTAQELRRIAQEAGIDASGSREEIAAQVADYISSFGRYSLTPLIAPDNEDFAIYFLETSKQGYCIHYATAATLMLRSMGVPARFTSGFVVTVAQSDVGLPVEVTDANAHAWVEVFFEKYGWLPYEVTPPVSGIGIPDGRPFTGGGPILEEPDFEEPDWARNPDRYDEPSRAGNEEPDAQGQQEAPAWTRILITVIIIAGIAAALNLRVVITRIIRKRRFAQADTNLAIICAWRYLMRLSRQKGWVSPAKTIEDLALKARFSQHRMTEQERDRVVGYVNSVADDIYLNSGFLRSFWVKYILGL